MLKSVCLYLVLGLTPNTEPPFDVCDISLCDFGTCVNVNGTATCVCNEACPFIEQPVCGSDNKTYSNLCVMDSETCEREERVTVQHDGPCGKYVFCTVLHHTIYPTKPIIPHHVTPDQTITVTLDQEGIILTGARRRD